MPRPVHIDPEILGGIPVFAGTRVPFQTLMDYLKEEQTLSAFLADFPTVTREQAVAALEAAEDAYGVAVSGGRFDPSPALGLPSGGWDATVSDCKQGA